MNGSRPPEQHEYAPFYDDYIQRVTGNDILFVLERQRNTFGEMIASLSREKGGYRYAEGKWTIKQLIQHVIDTERVFAYRLLCFSREEKNPLPGFDEKAYAQVANAAARSIPDLANEFGTVRSATLSLVRSLSEEDWDARGIASGMPVTVRALVYIIAGHCAHHRAMLAERYGVQ